MKKFFLALLTFLLTATCALFVSCGDNDPETDAPTTPVIDPITGEEFPDTDAGKNGDRATFAFVVRNVDGEKLSGIKVGLQKANGETVPAVSTDANGFCEYHGLDDVEYAIYYANEDTKYYFAETKTEQGVYEYFLTAVLRPE